MPRFNLLAPGRRHKTPAPLHHPAPPSHKAQKLLGAVDLSLDSPTLPRNWPTGGGSISNPDITIAEADDWDCLDDVNQVSDSEGKGGAPPVLRSYDEESCIIPTTMRIDRLTPEAGNESRSFTDASSLHRRPSSSTIESYYDKSKVPLFVSQQTSNSAMAKGLPAKASALLDMNGLASGASSKRKKPSRLDLSHLLPMRHRSSATRSHKSSPNSDTSTTSPSTLLGNTMNDHARSGKTNGRQGLRKKLMKEPMRPTSRYGPLQSPAREPAAIRGTCDSTELRHLYDHYEKMSMRDITDEAGADESASNGILDMEVIRFPSPPSIQPVSNGFLAPAARAYEHDAFTQKNRSTSTVSIADTPTTATISQKTSLGSPITDCAASISSRHTRTSKASKRTDSSFLDLQKTSVLSLSSDSEDDGASAAKSSVSMTRSPRRTSYSSSNARPTSSRNGARRTQRLSSLSSLGMSQDAISDAMSRGEAPTVTTRVSSHSLASDATLRGNRHQHHQSSTSSASHGSVCASFKTHGSQSSSFGSQDAARAIKMVPALRAASYRQASGGNRYMEESDRPLSSNSVDFHLRSHHSSFADSDRGSSPSVKSMSSVGHSSSNRVMAVTRQEEMLLAALRNKRARMREDTICEFDEEEEEEQILNATESIGEGLADGTHSECVDPSPLAPRPTRPRAGSIGAVSFSDFPMPTAAADIDNSPVEEDSGEDEHHESVLLFLDSTPALHTPEDSRSEDRTPDLGDFIDFDEDPHAQHDNYANDDSRVAPQDSGNTPVRRSRALTDQEAVGRYPLPMSKFGNREYIQNHGRETVSPRPDVAGWKHEEDHGVPRPDSPIDGMMHTNEPANSDKLPRKKAVRISAVGTVGMEAGWWGDDG